MSALVVVPTYDERGTLVRLLDRLMVAAPTVDVLVVDDASPDGTGVVADAYARQETRVHVLHRHAKLGLGSAYVDGFHWGLARGYRALVAMDADGSHDPGELPALLRALDEADGADVVVGSRWVRGGSASGLSFSRLVLSRAGSTYARTLLRLPVRDVTGGFRVYRATALQAMGLDDVDSRGYCFQIDLLLRAHRSGLRVTEVPITFMERTAGVSKMSAGIVAEAFTRVAGWAVRDLVAGVAHHRVGPPAEHVPHGSA